MAEICKEAQLLASLLLVNDEAFAREISDLIGQRNQYLAQIETGLYGGEKKKNIYEHLHTTEEKIDLFVEAKLLAGQGNYRNLGDEAKSKLFSYLENSQWKLARSVETLKKMNNATLQNEDVLAKLIADGTDGGDKVLVDNVKERLARFVLAKDKMRVDQGVRRELSDLLAATEKKTTNTAAKEGNIANKINTSKGKLEEGAIEQPTLFRRETPGVDDYNTLSQEEARNIVYKYFDSDEISVTFADNITTPEGQAALGAYHDGMITFAKTPTKGTPEHEVVHGYIGLCLTEQEKQLLYNAALDGHLDDIMAYMRLNGQSTLKEATEDWIADGFIKYKQRKATFTGKLKDLFDELWYRVKKLFGNEDKIRTLYKDIEAKKRPTSPLEVKGGDTRYKRVSISEENITPQKINKDPVLLWEYQSRINTMKIIQTAIADDLDILKNSTVGVFAVKDGLFGTLKVVDLGGDIVNKAYKYLKDGEKIEDLTVAQLRSRIMQAQIYFKNSHKRANVIAQMRLDREQKRKDALKMFKAPKIKNVDVSAVSSGITKAEKLRTLIKDAYNEDEGLELKQGRKADPIHKQTLSPESEKILKENIEKDVEQVRKGEAPSNTAYADDVWKQFTDMSEDSRQREALLNNYLIGKIYLGEGDDALESALKRLNGTNLEGRASLTLENIAKISDLGELEQVVFTHIGDIVYDKAIREALKEKQYELRTTVASSSVEEQGEALAKARSIQKTSEFLQAGGDYSSITLYDRVGRTLKDVFDEIDKKTDNRKLYDEFITAVTNFSSKKADVAEVGGMKMTATDLVRGIYAISWDDLVRDVASMKADATDQLKVAAKKLFNIGSTKDAKRAEARINDLFNSIAPEKLTNASITKMAYATTSAVDIKGEITDGNVVFYNYRDGLYAQDPQTSYGEFFDELAKQNVIVVDSEHRMPEVFKISEIPSDTKYIIVNDVNYLDDIELRDFLNSFKEEERPQVIYPRGMMIGNYYVEGGKLKYKTTSNQFYNELTRNVSARTLGAYAQTIEDVTEESVKDLENKAIEYFRTMMGLDMDGAPKNKAEYKERVINNLRIMTGLPISADMDVYNPQSTWSMANEIIRKQLGATGKYTKVIKDVESTVRDAVEKFNTNRAGFFADVKAIVGGEDKYLEQNADAIKDAYLDYIVAPSIASKVQSKGILMALANGGEFKDIDVDTFNAAIRDNNIVDVLGPVIYGPREYTKAEQEALQRLGEDMLATYVFDFSDNLIKKGYVLPLISPAESIRNYLRGEDIINNDFVQAFIKKNGLPQSSNDIEDIFATNIPSTIGYKIPISFILSSPGATLPNIVVEEIPNVIIPTNYNQLLAIVKKKGSKGGGIAWEEEAILKEILNNYYNEVERNIKAGTMTPTLAQQLKLQAGWALDRVEQDLIFDKYGSFLTAEQRNGLMGGKYKLRIATTEAELESVKKGNQEIISSYVNKLGRMGENWIDIYSNLGKAKEALIEKGKIMTVVNGKVVTANVHDILIEQINTLPEGLKGIFENFRSLTKADIKAIPYANAYSLVKAIDIAKNAAARGNLYARLMYKQNPQLANIDFFRRYTLNSDGIPQAIARNAAGTVDSSINDGIDLLIKQNIMLDISQEMKKIGKLSNERLDEIVQTELATYDVSDTIKNHYKNIFKAYTYLTDIPKDIKNTINGMLDAQLKEVRAELKEAGSDFYEGILNTRITLADGTEMTLRDVLAGDIDSYRGNLFIEKDANGVYQNVNMKETTSNELGLTDSQVIEYSDAMYSMLNSLNQVTDAERYMTTSILNNARKILSKYTTTKKLIDADYIVGGQNDLLRNLIKNNAFSGWGKLWSSSDMISKAWDAARNAVNKKLGGEALGGSFFNKENWNAIRNYYYTYYGQSLDALESMKVGDKLQATALEMAKYFKKIEETLGSADGIKGASINTELNRAFGRIGTVVLHINTPAQVHSLLNLIGNNQVLGFFKFAKKGDGAYFDLFSALKADKQTFTGIEYIKGLQEQDLKRFNEVFNSNFSMGEFKIIMQALGGYRVGGAARNWLSTIMQGINSSSVLARAIMSYPFQLFTIAPQSIAYNFKANAYKRAEGIEDMAVVNRIREGRDILTSDYIELNPSSWFRNVLKKYTGDEIQELIEKEGVEMDDGIMELFGKAYDHAASNYTREQFVQLFDATRDNANNIIDALMAQRFKNLAFVKALQTNNVMPFRNAETFDEFMNNINIPQEFKDQVMDAVRIYSGRIFKDMLGTGFSGLDKVYASSAAGQVLVGLMNMVNFRGAWGLNMFRQTLEKIWSVAKTLRFVGDKRAMDQAVDYLARTPEFSNLSQAMFNDLVWMWKLARFSDNGKQPDDNSEADFMDFCEWVLNNRELVSQQWQGIMSFGPIRPLIAAAEAEANYISNPEMYGSNAWAGALINTLFSNIGRNRKPWKFAVTALRAAQADGDMSRAWNYAADNFYTLSAGTLRYMLEEGYNEYGANTPLVYERGGIPSFIAGEQWEGSDTAFLYQMRQEETANYLTNLIKGEDGYSLGGMFGQLMNYSQLFSLMKESVKGAGTALGVEEWKSSKSTYDLSDMDEAYKDVPEWQEWRKYGFIMPKHEAGYETYYDAIVNYFTESKAPGGSNFYKGISKFLMYGHINGKENGSSYDKTLEEFYTRIQEKDPGALESLVNNEALMAEVASDTKKSIQTSLSFMEKELALFEGDAEYNKYAAAIYKGVMSNVMYDELEKFAEQKTNEYRARGLLGKKDKLSASEIRNKIPALYSEFKQQFVDSHREDLRIADTESMEYAMFNFLAKKSKEASDKFFDIKTFTDDDGNEVERYYLKSNLRSQVNQLIDFEAAMRNGEYERAVIEGTALTKKFSYDHTVSPEVALHIFNRIKSLDNITYKGKLEAMTEFVANNLDAFTPDSEFAKKFPELWNEVKGHYNEIVYQVSKDLIDASNDYALSLESDEEKKGSGSSKKLKAALAGLAKIQQQTSGGKSSSGSNRGSYTFTWLKAPILDPTKIFVEDSKTPKVNFNPKFTSKGYTPKTNLGGSKTTAKPVKVTKKKVKEKDIEVI